jgi:hypothetical protein
LGFELTNKRAILLSGTIIPASVYTEYKDPERRLQDYITSIRFYCKALPNDDIYFLENSSFPLEAHKDFQKLSTECQFHVLRFPPSEKYYEGKGFQEFEMLDKAFLNLESKYETFVKITGRYIIRNIAKLLNDPCPGLLIDLNKRHQLADTFLLIYTRNFYRTHVLGLFNQVNDNESRIIERVMYGQIISRQLLNQCRLFSYTTELEGITGSYGIPLKRNRFKQFIRNIERKVYNTLGVKQFPF